VSVYEVTGDADIIAVGKFTDTDDMNDQIKSILTDADIRGVEHECRTKCGH